MRRRLTLLSFVLCVALAADAPAQGAPRGAGAFNGGRGFSAPRAPTSASRSAGSFGSRGASSARSASAGVPQLGWRSNASAGSGRSFASRDSRLANRATPRYASGQTANGSRSLATPRFSSGQGASRGLAGTRGASPTARATSRSGGAAAASSTDGLSPFARNLARSSSGSRFLGRDAAATRGATATRGTGASATGARSAGAQPRGRGAARSPGADQVPGTADRRAGQTGFVRQSPNATAAGTRRGAAAASGRAVPQNQVAGSAYRRYGYTARPYSTYPSRYGYGYGYGYGPYYCSPYYASSGFYLGFTFGAGAYLGLSYYSPWYYNGSNYAFFYGAPLSYCYVPYGFYCDAPATYVTRYVYVQDTYPTTNYETVEAAPPVAEPSEGQKVVEPEPAAGSPVAEKYLRDASDAFRKAEYLEAAKLFRLAALSTPDNAAPLFALGQSLIAIGSDAYAAKVIRKAVLMNPGLVKEPGDIVGVFSSQEEFDRVMGELFNRAGESPAGSDARFLLAAEYYFSGDPKAVEGFRDLRAALPGDEAVGLFSEAAEKRFSAADDLPPVVPAPK